VRALGIDLGGSSMKWSLLELADGAGEPVALAQGQRPTPGDGPASVVAELCSLAAAIVAEHGPAATVGVGVPGLYEAATGRTRFLPNLAGDWSGVDVAGPVGGAAGAPAVLINDARACTLAELRCGAGRGCSTLVCVALGTGVGGGVVVDGRVHLGLDGTGGELGHQTLDPDGPPCGCGNNGCLEAYCSSGAIAAACGTATVVEAVQAALAGNEEIRAALAGVGRRLGVALANVVVVLTPDRIIVGGGIAGAGELLLAPALEEIRRRVRVTDVSHLRLVPAELGLWSGSVGAALAGAEAFYCSVAPVTRV
jgi:glucokinase